MMLSRYSLAIAAVLILAASLGCGGRLRTKIDIVNPEYIDKANREKGYLRVMLQLSIDQNNVILEGEMKKIQEMITGLCNSINAQSQQSQAATQQSQDANGCTKLKGLKEKYEETFMAFNSAIRNLFNTYDDAKQNSILNGDEPMPKELASIIINFIRSFRDYKLKIQETITATAKKAEEDNKSFILDQVVKQRHAFNWVSDPRFSLGLDPNAYLVATAPDDQWEEHYNKAHGFSFFGDMDLAIMLSPAGNLTVKGLRFDARGVAAAASKISTQLVLMGAQVAGVPVKLSSTTGVTDGKAMADASSALADLNLQNQEAEAEYEEYKSALWNICQTILDQEDAIKGNDAARKRAILIIKSSIEANLTRIGAPEPNGGEDQD